MNPPSVKRTVMPKQAIRAVGGISGMSYSKFLRGGGMNPPTPTSKPPKPRKSLIKRRLPILGAQKEQVAGIARGGLNLRGRFGR